MSKLAEIKNSVISLQAFCYLTKIGHDAVRRRIKNKLFISDKCSNRHLISENDFLKNYIHHYSITKQFKHLVNDELLDGDYLVMDQNGFRVENRNELSVDFEIESEFLIIFPIKELRQRFRRFVTIKLNATKGK